MAKQYIITPKRIIETDGGSLYDSGEECVYQNLDGFTEEKMLLLPLDDYVVFPYLKLNVPLENADAVEIARKAMQLGEPVFLFSKPYGVPDKTADITEEEIIHSRGVVGIVTEVTPGPGEMTIASVKVGPRAILMNLNRRTQNLRGNVMYSIADPAPDKPKQRKKWKKICAIYDSLSQYLTEEDRKELGSLLRETDPDCIRHLYFMLQNSPINPEDRYHILEANSISDQTDLMLECLEKEHESMAIRSEIHQKTMAEMGHRQRDEYLRTQMQQIKNELGESDDFEIKELEERAKKKEWTDETRDRFNKELRKLTRFNPTSPDYSIQYTFLDSYLSLPWLHCDNSEFTLDKVEEVLDRDHYGLEKVKERIVEQMAVLKLRKDTKAPILCLYGPPGVGKTSLGKSVAESLGRKYVRVALGGLHDEAEIRGHRRTYLGSMPGRILNALDKCGTSDPVMVLDEIDKIGADYKGDPSQALLEVLDPEQNCRFHDNYIDQDYDLSKVLFIATANTLSKIAAPLLDRMELIEIGGYVEAEKIRIAQRHLIGKNLVEHGFEADEVAFTDEAISEIIGSYTRESGVRKLEKKINDVLRKLARLKAGDKDFPKVIGVEEVKRFLGKPEAFSDVYENNDIPGIVTGLAWTQAGGEILFIESSTAPGKECKLVLTGNLGDVMKESAMLALQYIKANHERLGIPEKALEVGTVHIHVPEGAVPKDGPSAGVTIVTSLASTFTGRKVRPRLAMTGEITLRGKVLPVGGIKEKILAAKRAGIDIVMLCEKNRKDIEEIKPEYLEGLSFHYVENVDEVLDFALI